MVKQDEGNGMVALSTAESRELKKLIEVVSAGLKKISETGTEVGIALRRIRDGELFLATHGTFIEFTRDTFNIEKSQAYRMIDFAVISETLSPIGEKPKCESQVRPIAGLDPEDQKEVWELAIDHAKENGKAQPTAKDVKAARDELFPPAAEDDPEQEEAAEDEVDEPTSEGSCEVKDEPAPIGKVNSNTALVSFGKLINDAAGMMRELNSAGGAKALLQVWNSEERNHECNRLGVLLAHMQGLLDAIEEVK